MPLSFSVQKKILEFAQKDDDSQAEELATNIVLNFRSKIYKKYGNTYINEVMNNNTVIRWSLSSMPLKYFVQCDKDTPNYYYEQIDSAFKDWQRESDEIVKFQKINNPTNANIIISFKGTAPAYNQNTEYKIALTSPIIENEIILKRMKINAFVKTDRNEFLTPNQVKTVITHEIGHALGIWGHSKDNTSVMYSSLTNPFNFYERRIDTPISSKDIDTLKLLYALAPDVCDNINDVNHKEQFICPQMILSPVDNDKEKKIEEAKRLLKEHPNDMEYALALADTYNSNGKYTESIALMTFLTEQTTDKNLLNILFYNISNAYISINDFNNAMLFAKKAQNCSNSTENKCLIAYIKYINNDLDNAEKDYYEILSKTPNSKNAALGLADIYIKKREYRKTKQILKYILQYYPELRNEKIFNQYKIYVLF
jgi:predicted Zn-dependent protease